MGVPRKIRSQQLALTLGAAVFWGVPSAGVASDCPRLGLPQPKEERFCKEFRDLLYAPYNPNTKRAVPGRQPNKDIRPLLKSNPLWGEVYRSDPKRTLQLLARIKKAGGDPQ